MTDLVLSLFPGIGLLDMAFEEEGFCVVRGPDLLWGGDIKRFHPPAGKFDGVIGGPPCQAHSRYAGLNRSVGNVISLDLVPEFGRVVSQARPEWWLMENVPAVQDLHVTGYVTARTELDNRWLGEEQQRRRIFQFGSRNGDPLRIQGAVFDHSDWQPTCMASEGKHGRIERRRTAGVQRSVYNSRREWGRFCELQGLPPDFLADAPFTIADRYKVVGNGVPLAMGRAVAKAVKRAIERREDAA